MLKQIKVLAVVALGTWALALAFANSQLPQRCDSRTDQVDKDYERLKAQLVELQSKSAPMKDRAAAHLAIGICLLSKQQPDIAAMEFLKYAQLTAGIKGVSSEEVSRSLNIVGTYYLSLKDYDTCQRYYQQALALDRTAHNSGVARDLNNLATLYFIWGRNCPEREQAKHELCFQLAQDYFSQAMAAAKESDKGADEHSIVAVNSQLVKNEIANEKPTY